MPVPSLPRTYHPGLYDYPPVELFDMRCDPREERNVATEHPDRVGELTDRLESWRAHYGATPGGDPDPLGEVIRTGPWKYVTPERWNERLRAAGRPIRTGPTFPAG